MAGPGDEYDELGSELGGSMDDQLDASGSEEVDYSDFDDRGDTVELDASEGSIIPGEDVVNSGFDQFSWSGGAVRAAAASVEGALSVRADSSAGPAFRERYAGRSASRTGNPYRDRVIAILTTIAQNVGKWIALKAATAIIRKWGMPAASAAFGVNANDLTFLLAASTLNKRGRGRRGPHLHTVLKRIRRGRRYEHMLRKYATKAGIHQHQRGAPRGKGKK